MSRNIVSLLVSRFSPCIINLLCNKKCSLILCCRLKEVNVKSRVRVYFEQPILALFLVFHQTYNQSCHATNLPMLRDNLGVLYLVFFTSFTLMWVAGQQTATVVVCFSFALIEFSLKWFLSFFILIVLCPPASSRFGTLRVLHGDRVLFWLAGR